MNHITELYLEYISNNEYNLLEAKKNKPPVISYQVRYILDKGLATAAVFLPGGVLYFVTRKLYDMYDYKCAVNCYIIKDTKNEESDETLPWTPRWMAEVMEENYIR